MRAGDLLRQLDQRLLPRLVGAVTCWGQGPTRPPVLSWVAVFCAAAVMATAMWAADSRPVGDPTLGDVTRVGVSDGDSIPGYVQAAAADLAALPASVTVPRDGTYALVTLSEYLTPQSLPGVVGDVRVAAVLGRVPLPDRQTEIVRIAAQRLPDDVTAGMTVLADRKDREAADYRARAAVLAGGNAQERELRQFYEVGARVAAEEAAAYRSGCACLYAVVVRAQPGVLRGVANRPGVRAVDPAPEVDRLERAVFTPPLPEQRDVVRPTVDAGLDAAPSIEDRSGGPTGVPSPEAVPSPPDVTSSSPRPASTPSSVVPSPVASTWGDVPERGSATPAG
ncbi:hypothetical protein GA0070616_0894 [Micromonospora nigra]|uniref:Uncharacterized protein n=1 Tax=Micromonospora nigra TaxID=145857 RepID=A0A1C6RFM6_9ACTN|nr:hypothetical protein [Micromonospora nigra]SCL15990.1 hypothetical protein GA0070616_0894 [Micromonospora nigra]